MVPNFFFDFKQLRRTAVQNVGKLIFFFFGMQGSKIQIVFIYVHLSYLVRQERCVIFFPQMFLFSRTTDLSL